MGKKPIVSITYENERISIKNSLPYLKCVTSLLCGPRADLWSFYGFLCKPFSLDIKVYQGWAFQRSGSTDPTKENGRKSTRGPHRRDVTHILSKVSCFLLKSCLLYTSDAADE